jgi:galactonate dehydratase
MTSEPFRITQAVFTELPVRGGSHWYFLELSNADGVTGLAEFSYGVNSIAVARAIAQMVEELRDEEITDETKIPDMVGLSPAFLQSDRVLAIAITAIRNAILDAQAQIAEVPLYRLLGGSVIESVELYGNINRSMLKSDSGDSNRSPASFAAVAERAAEEGFGNIKCAPFDECKAPFDGSGLPDEAKAGLDRIAAVKEALGDKANLFVDCHCRFDLESALALEPELAARGVAWYEEPVSYRTHRDDLAAINAAATMDVAGAEDGYGVNVFQSLIAANVTDVVMPDVKYCGGAGEAVLIGNALEAISPGSVSMHSPAGPVSMLASAHATAAFNGSRPLEHAVWEVDWRATVLEPAEHIHDGQLFIPDGYGIGATLNEELMSSNGRRWSAT